jgi:aspartate aminotransferase
MHGYSALARELTAETAFTVLALARDLRARGKEVIELEIGDSPFPTPPHAREAGIRAIAENLTRYAPSLGLPELRAAAARWAAAELGIACGPEHVAVANGAKPFQQYFAESVLEPGDGVLIFSPHFPTYVPNIERRGARPVLVPLRAMDAFRPRARAVADFLSSDPRPRAVFLNSPHNPTGGVAATEDLDAIADVVRGTDLLVFSDEPYCHLVWTGRHETLLTRPGMFDHVVAAYTFSKSFSMSGWRVGFAIASPALIEIFGKLINTAASCTPPFVQIAAVAALERDGVTRDDYMRRFRLTVERLTAGLARIEGVRVLPPAGTFYAFPDVRNVCNRLGVTSHGLALYLLEGADDHLGVACLGGEAFGDAGRGYLRFSCAEPDERISRALGFLVEAFNRPARARAYLARRPDLALAEPYSIELD